MTRAGLKAEGFNAREGRSRRNFLSLVVPLTMIPAAFREGELRLLPGSRKGQEAEAGVVRDGSHFLVLVNINKVHQDAIIDWCENGGGKTFAPGTVIFCDGDPREAVAVYKGEKA